jgi:hypothetical protein
MKKIIEALFLSVFSLVVVTGYAQEQQSFPAAWQGEWKGNLEIFGPQGKVNQVAMELHILPTDSADFSWTIFYGEDKAIGKRDYLIRLVDEKAAHFEVDEQNSIFLDAYLLGDKLIERFEVQGNMLSATTEKVDGKLIFEVFSGPLGEPRVTGGEMQGEESIPEVKSYRVNVRQKAILSLN